MKDVYLIGGTMGVGKTTVCKILTRRLERAVFLDGDWCWFADPFQVDDETKAMVLDNICHVLGNFIKCSAYANVIFCWVMHEQSIIDAILLNLSPLLDNCRVKNISLICDEAALRARLNKDVALGLRRPDVIARSLARLACYKNLDTAKLYVSGLSPDDAADLIIKHEAASRRPRVIIQAERR